MKKIVAFGASTSSTSINQQLAVFAASQVENAQADTISLRDYQDVTIYSIDEEKENGFPAQAMQLREKMLEYDGFIVSLAEHNGSYSAAFKNLFDWLSRMEGKVWNDKPVLIMGTSPGARGAQTVIESGASRFPWNGAKEVTGTFSLPSFYDNFSADSGITDGEKLNELKEVLNTLVSKL